MVHFPRPLPIASLSLLLAVPLAAQTHFTSPPGFASTEGAGSARFLGASPDGRHVIMDGEYRGHPFVLREVAFRTDYRTRSSRYFAGRSWSKVDLTVAECDIAAGERTFANMPTTAPTRVFSGPVSWPTLTGQPSGRPTSWDFRFPFATAWSYSGREDMMFDFNFEGGRLTNGDPWTNYNYYYLDAAHNTLTYNRGRVQYFGKAGTGQGCIDSAAGGNTGALANLVSFSYGDQYPHPRYRNQLELRVYTNYTAPGQPVALGVGVAGGMGARFPGVSCNPLYLDLTQPHVFLFPRAASSSTATTNTQLALTPFQSSMVGLKLYAQAGWNESSSGQLQLTRASSVTIAGQPPRLPNRQAYYAFKPTQTWGYGPSREYNFLPVARLTK